MKKLLSTMLTLALAATYAVLPVNAAGSTETISYNYTYTAANGYASSDVHTREMEKLDRGLVAVKVDGGVYLSWRLFDSEDTRYGSAEENVSFDIYRDGNLIGTEENTTNYLDPDGTVNSVYQVVPEGAGLTTTISHNGSTVTVNTPESGLTAYAAKYTDGALEQVISKPVTPGKTVFNAGFEIDKTFIWNDMEPAENKVIEGVTPYANSYFDIPLVKPATETIYDNSGNKLYDASFFPADCSTGDLDGDGEYEIIVKWTSSEKDVGSPGDPAYSGTIRLAAYKLDGTKLWDNDINLGRNIYSSAHTLQFLVYDFDMDGKSELICQTSLGSKDAKEQYVSKSADPKTNADIYNISDSKNDSADYRNASWGLITTGEEFLTVFNGETGAAIDTIPLPTARGNALDWGDANNTAGNRVNRFIADVAYLDGERPYAVYLRGYYFGKDNNGRQRTSIAGISFDGERLSPDYRFDTKKGEPGYYEGAYQYVGQGNHNCTVADVDGDGKDEFITGALCMEVNDNNEFKPRWCTYLQHGDALHIGDYDPTHPGFEFFTVHEDDGVNNLSGKDVTMDFGMSVIDADTGEIMFHVGGPKDTGRGIMANIGAGGYYQIIGSNSGTYRSNGGTNFTSGSYGMSQNFRIFWDGDLYDELLDGTSVTKYTSGTRMSSIFNASNYGCVQINGTKANPALQADLFGDWREELVYPTSDGNNLRVFTTTTQTKYKIKTLMHDPVYRSGVAAEQTAYNQPPHVGFYMGSEMFDASVTDIQITTAPTKTVYTLGEELNPDGMVVTATLSDGTTKTVNAYSVSGYDKTVAGEQTVTITYMGKSDTFKVTVKALDRIEITSSPSVTEVYQGGTLKTDGLVVTAYYEDGTSFEVSDYTLDYSTETLGVQTVTVSYMGKPATFEITVLEPGIAALDGTYVSESTAADNLTIVPIGEHTGNFIIMHKLTINSMPASGSNDKSSTAGFFLRFMCPNNGIGGGWYFTTSRNSTTDASVYWKHSSYSRITSQNQTLKVGETYTFMYKFMDVGTGKGAYMNMTITDSIGNTVGEGTNLDLRNLTQSDPHKVLPLTHIEIYNQARDGAVSSVTISDTTIIEN